MSDNKTSPNNNDTEMPKYKDNNDTDIPKDEEKELHNNNIFGRGRAGGIYRGRGYNRGIGHLAQNRGRFRVMNRGRGQDYRDRGQADNTRGRYGHTNNNRGRGFGWYYGGHNSGRGFGWYAGHNSKFYKPRMINTGPWSAASAYRARQQPRFHSQYSTPPINTKIFMNPATEFNPQIPPPSYYNSYKQGYLDPTPGCSNCHPQAGASTSCTYYHPQAGASLPQGFVTDSASGLVVVDNKGQMYNYQGGSFGEVEDNALSLVGQDNALSLVGQDNALSLVGQDNSILQVVSQDNSILQVVGQDNSILQVVAQMPRPEVLQIAMSGLGLASSGGLLSSSSGGLLSSSSGGLLSSSSGGLLSSSSGGMPSASNIDGEKPSNNNEGEEAPSEKDGAGEVLSYNHEISKTTAYIKRSADEENSNLMEPENKPGQEAGDEVIPGTGCAVHLATVANPLSRLGQSVEGDKQLVGTFAGVEMRPVSPFPPNYRLQYYFVPYGTPPPEHVVPVMVFPVFHPEANAGTQGREPDVQGGQSQVKENRERTHENEFPPPRSLLPSYMGSMDFPCSPLPVEFYQPEPSPVEIYQPFTNPWPHQFMMDPLATNEQSSISLQIHQSDNENNASRQ